MTAEQQSNGLKLPAQIEALLFDLDGVITRTAVVHAAAWKEMFDSFLTQWNHEHGQQQPEFDSGREYDRFVDGRPRYDGVRAFLSARSIDLPDGDPSDPPDRETVCGLGNRKNQLVTAIIARDGVAVYEDTLKLIEAATGQGLRRGVVSSSANARLILQSCGLVDHFECIVDGVVAAERGISGKPAPDTFLEGARELGVEPATCCVFEDAIAGVEAGHAGGFGWVVGVDRVGQGSALLEHGADIALDDLRQLIR